MRRSGIQCHCMYSRIYCKTIVLYIYPRNHRVEVTCMFTQVDHHISLLGLVVFIFKVINTLSVAMELMTHQLVKPDNK